MALVVQDQLVGYIDTSGKEIIPPQYTQGLDFTEGLAAVLVGDKWGYIDRNGKMIIEPFEAEQVHPFSEELAAVLVGNKWGYIDKSGKFVIPPTFEDHPIGFKVADFSDGLAIIKVGDKFGFMNQSGDIVIEPIYEMAGSFTEGLAAVRLNGLDGYIDTKGNVVIDFKYASGWPFQNGYAKVNTESVNAPFNPKMFSVIDKSGNVMLAEMNAEFFEGIAWVPNLYLENGFITGYESFVNYYTPEGKQIKTNTDSLDPIPPDNLYYQDIPGLISMGNYKKGKPFHNGVAVFGDTNKVWAAINKQGEILFAKNLQQLDDFSNDLAAFIPSYSKDNKYGYLNKQGEVVIEPKYDKAGQFSES